VSDWGWPAWQESIAATPAAIWLLIGLLLVPYLLGVARIWRAAGRGRGVTTRQTTWYGAGVAVLLLALVSPLDSAADAWFSMHMVQHLILIIVAPPLLILGAPQIAVAWAIFGGRPVRHRWTRRATHWIDSAAHWLTLPLVALAVHTAAVWTWHLPALFEAARASAAIHGVEHASFLGSALMLWSAVLPRHHARRERYGFGVLLMLATAMQSGALGALLVSSNSTWYPAQAAATIAMHGDPLADQQLAGLLMWIPGGVAYTVAACALLLAWIGHATERATPAMLAEENG
jgi:putative membrane protein